MAELTKSQRRVLVDGLTGPNAPIPGSSPILPPTLAPYGFARAYPQLNGIPSAVAQAIAPNFGMNRGSKGDFVTGAMPTFPAEPDPMMMNVRPPNGDRRFEIQGQPIAPSPPMLRGV